MRARRLRPALLACVLSATAASASVGSPEIDYMLQCQGCHLADGAGMPPDVPALSGHMARFLGVPGGRSFLVRVPGSAQSPLDDAALAAVLNWMLQRFGPADIAAQHPPYSAEEVARLRAEPLVDVVARRAELVAAIEARR